MCDKCKIVKRQEVNIHKKDLIFVMDEIKKDHKNKFGKGVNGNLVGSAKRNLVYQRKNSEWDIDWQIRIDRELLEEELGNTEEIKNWFLDKFKKYMNNNKYTIANSTSVITINKINNNGNFKSYDVAILSNDKNTNKVNILKKVWDENRNEYKYIWNELSDKSSYLNRQKEINGPKHWKKLRDFYKNAKCENSKLSKDKQKPSSAILSEAINHTIQKRNNN